MSRRSARFTQADIVRCIRAARQCGASQVVILPDGEIRIDLQQADEPEKSDVANPRRRFGERLEGGSKQAAPWDDPDSSLSADPLAKAFHQWERGELTLDQLPPGRYPNGMRVYADGEWEALIRSKPLGKREIGALQAYFEADGAPDIYAGGYDTNSRLEARGLIESSTGQNEHRAFRLTAAGKEEWLRRRETK